MKAVFTLTPLGVLATLLTIVYPRPLGAPILGSLVYIASLSLFWWTTITTRQSRLSIVFSTDTPKLLVDAGPYAWIRHPFYTSYILFWVAGFIATGAAWLVLPVAVMSVLYWRAAEAEESKFSYSSLAYEYASYAARTKRFVPWIL
jgi:protein-S-isoprenylcysteine O-methyltransferase Ste14